MKFCEGGNFLVFPLIPGAEIMSLKVYKYQIPTLHGDFTLKIPGDLDTQILSIQWQQEFPVLWVLVDPRDVPMERHFRAVMTGEDIDLGTSAFKFLQTLQLTHKADVIVCHFFEVKDAEKFGT